ncbi:MAG: hypothetical protein JWN78_35 [Bacteroidota bacterium]|nr:hypothetical protein [Bacteroidota bacterium]
METLKTNSKFLLITALIAVAVIFRIIPHPFNFTPVVAISLFAGAKFRDKKWAILIPVISMFISDILLSVMNHYTLFHDTIFFVYGSILLIIFLGRNLQGDKLNFGKTAVFTLVSSILFFVITNIGVWLFGGLYSMDAAGFTKCFAMAVPFFKYTLLGDAFFVTVLFGIYEYVSRKYPHILDHRTLETADL